MSELIFFTTLHWPSNMFGPTDVVQERFDFK